MLYVNSMLSNIPSLPTTPEFPHLTWCYQDDLYGLKEGDVDKLLNYAENTLPLFIHELNTYEKKLNVILEALKADLMNERSI